MRIAGSFRQAIAEQGDDVNLAFELEVQTNADGNREIVGVECEPTKEEARPDIGAEVIAPGSWIFDLVLPNDFSEDEAAFRRFRRHRVEPEAAYEACRDAMAAAVAQR
jgi:transposase-like protein